MVITPARMEQQNILKLKNLSDGSPRGLPQGITPESKKCGEVKWKVNNFPEKKSRMRCHPASPQTANDITNGYCHRE